MKKEMTFEITISTKTMPEYLAMLSFLASAIQKQETGKVFSTNVSETVMLIDFGFSKEDLSAAVLAIKGSIQNVSNKYCFQSVQFEI